MSVTIHLSGYLKPFAGGETEIALPGEFSTVGEVLDSLWVRHLRLRDRVLTEAGEIRQHVNIFVGSENVRHLDNLATKIKSDDIHIFNAVSGG
ncbi:MAG: MoaD/ThiS family protein [Pyrinomonadaceae bacterium]